MLAVAKVISRVLEAFFRVEEAIDKLFLSFIDPLPLKSELIQSAIELLDTRKKIDFINKHELLDKGIPSRLHELHNKRNNFAHKRSSVINNGLDLKELNAYKTECSNLKELLLVKAQAVLEDFEAKIAGPIS